MITYTEKGIWLHDAIQAAGHEMYNLDGVWHSDDDVAVQVIIDGFDPLPFAKAESIKKLKDHASAKILATYPVYKQMNMNMRAAELQEIRINGLTLDAAQKAELSALTSAAVWIKSVRSTSQSAENIILAETVWGNCDGHADVGIAAIEAL